MGAHADAVVRDSDADVPLGQLVLAEELLERLAERLGVAHLAPVIRPGGSGESGQLDDLDGAVHGEAGGGEPRGAKLEADDLLRTESAPTSRPREVPGLGSGIEDQTVPLEQALQLVGPARAVERRLGGDLPVADDSSIACSRVCIPRLVLVCMTE